MNISRKTKFLVVSISLLLGVLIVNIGMAFASEPPPPPTNPGTGTPGYWKNHPEAWPVEKIYIGYIGYSKAEAISIMQTPGKGDKTYTMFNALAAAILNVQIGNDPSCIQTTIDNADYWMSMYSPVGSGVRGNSDAWQELGEHKYEKLDAYNNGKLCAPARD